MDWLLRNNANPWQQKCRKRAKTIVMGSAISMKSATLTLIYEVLSKNKSFLFTARHPSSIDSSLTWNSSSEYSCYENFSLPGNVRTFPHLAWMSLYFASTLWMSDPLACWNTSGYFTLLIISMILSICLFMFSASSFLKWISSF